MHIALAANGASWADLKVPKDEAISAVQAKSGDAPIEEVEYERMVGEFKMIADLHTFYANYPAVDFGPLEECKLGDTVKSSRMEGDGPQ